MSNESSERNPFAGIVVRFPYCDCGRLTDETGCPPCRQLPSRCTCKPLVDTAEWNEASVKAFNEATYLGAEGRDSPAAQRCYRVPFACPYSNVEQCGHEGSPTGGWKPCKCLCHIADFLQFRILQFWPHVGAHLIQTAVNEIRSGQWIAAMREGRTGIPKETQR